MLLLSLFHCSVIEHMKTDCACACHEYHRSIRFVTQAECRNLNILQFTFVNVCRYEAHLYPELIKSRLYNDYYRSLEAVKHDIMVMLDNAQSYFKKKELAATIAYLHSWFTKKLNRLYRDTK